jgi:hypothetical protein
MPLHALADIVRNHREIAICCGAAAADVHRNLYHLADGAYITIPDGVPSYQAISGLVQTCADDPACREIRLHVVVDWDALLHLSAGKDTLRWPDLYLVLKDAGVKPEEMQPFKDAPPADLFPWLYYGKRFDVLRKLCLQVKRKLDVRLAAHDVRTVCHLVGDDGSRIVASSL